ncbi:MAG TPA: response regulator [Roseiflexaceae bacterium]|nr:response regulator [Roseiflexaceae bacterium]
MPNHILLVEDSRTQALRFQLELLRYGLSIEIASSGTGGLAAARATRPDAIVLDVDLPELDGFSVCRSLKADPSTASIPVIMLTHRDQAHEALAGLELGAIDYIPKDAFAEHNLVQALHQLGMI